MLFTPTPWSKIITLNSHTVHCKDKMPKFRNTYSQKRNIGASVPISAFMCLWANYIFPRWSCRFCWRKYVDRSWEYINRSQTHKCGNWVWGRAIPRKGIYQRKHECGNWGWGRAIPRKEYINGIALKSHTVYSCMILHFIIIVWFGSIHLAAPKFIVPQGQIKLTPA